MLLPAIDKKLRAANSIVLAHTIDERFLKLCPHEDTFLNSLERIKYLLEIELNANKEIMDLIQQFEEQSDITLLFVTSTQVEKSGLASKANQFQEAIQKVIKESGGNDNQVIQFALQQTKRTSEKLLKAIKEFLKNKKQK
jgi:hypothetical protein